MSDGSDSMVGRRFGSYVVEQKLGEGGMGAVYRAIQPEIGKQVAIKFLAEHLSQNPQVVQRFFAEAKSVNLIQHDNIVDIFDFGQLEGHSFFVMELMKGHSLEAVLVSKGQLAIGRSVDIAVQVADAISAAHARQIIHRDLKPDNIFLVTKSGRHDFVKLLDFGIAKLTDTNEGTNLSRTMAGAVLGTPGYMSPEQGTGGAVDARTDIYALGVILFRMLAGRLPFEGDTFPMILQKQLIEPPPNLRMLRPEIPATLATLVHQMIARDANERPATMADVLQRLVPMMPADYGREGSGSFRAMGSSSSSPTPLPSGPISIIPPNSTTLSGATGQRDSSDSFGDEPARRRGTGLFIGGGAALVLAVAGVAMFGMGGKGNKEIVKPTAVVQGAPAPTVAAPSAPARAPAIAPVPAVAAPAPAVGSFAVYVETNPPGAQIFEGGRSLGVTPQKLTLSGETASIRLHLSGYRDEQVDVSAQTEHTDRTAAPRAALVALAPAGGGEPPAAGAAAGAAARGASSHAEEAFHRPR